MELWVLLLSFLQSLIKVTVGAVNQVTKRISSNIIRSLFYPQFAWSIHNYRWSVKASNVNLK